MSASEKKPPAAGKRASRVRRMIFWLALLALAGTLAVTGGGAWAYKYRTSLANRILRQTFAAFDAQIGDLQVSRQGIDITGVTVRDPRSRTVIATARGILWRPEWSKMAAGNIGRFSLVGARVDADAEQLRAWTAARVTEEPSPSAPAGIRLPPLVLEHADLRDVSVNVRGDEHTPSITFKLEHSIDGLDISDLARPKLTQAALSISDLLVTQTDGEQTALASLSITARLRETDGILEIERAALRGVRVKLTAAMRDWLQQGNAGPAKSPSPLPPWLHGVAVTRLDIDGCEFRAGGDALPLSGGASFSCHSSNFVWQADGSVEPGEHRVEMRDVVLAPPSGGGGLRVPMLSVETGIAPSMNGMAVKSVVIEKPSVEWTQALEDALLHGSPGPSSNGGSATGAFPLVAVAALTMKDAALVVHQTHLCPLEGKLTGSVDLAQIEISTGGITSEVAQKVRLSDVALSIHREGMKDPQPLASVAGVELEVTPREWNRDALIDRLAITKPEIRLTEQTAPWARSSAPTSATASTTPPTAESGEMLWQRIHFRQLELSDGRFEFSTTGSGRIDASTAFSVTTEPAPDQNTGAPLHRLRLTNARGMIPDVAKLPVAGLESFDVVVRLPNVWRDKHVESLEIKGGQIEAGEALMSLLSGGDSSQIKPMTADVPKPADASQPAPPPITPEVVETKTATGTVIATRHWTVGNISVGDVAVTLQKVAPGLPPLRFVVSIEAKDTPLEPEALAKHAVKQRVELSDLVIPSTLNPLRSVARLDTIFVEFTLGGLFARRIDSVEIVSPTLLVGEDLFWYVDYIRKYTEPPPKVPPGLPVGAAPAVAPPAAEITIAPANNEAWTVDSVQVHSGKLVLAPKGVPLPGGFGKPFPFSFVTRMDQGRFDATLDIPPDTYALPDLKVEFRVLTGHVQFNLPVKGVNNNLTEVFRADQIRWKDLHIDDAHLSVTYDANGIYGQFGGAAYDGYVSGAFNVYLDQVYSWDGWIAATAMRTTEVTHRLCPEYFMLDGKVDGKLVALGSSQELYQADLSFKNVTPGNFSVAAMNSIIRDYADTGAVALSNQIVRIGLETLRDFEYDTVAGEGRFYGREGKGFLRFKGPSGARNFDVNVFDHRWKDEPKNKSANDESVAGQ